MSVQQFLNPLLQLNGLSVTFRPVAWPGSFIWRSWWEIFNAVQAFFYFITVLQFMMSNGIHQQSAIKFPYILITPSRLFLMFGGGTVFPAPNVATPVLQACLNSSLRNMYIFHIHLRTHANLMATLECQFSSVLPILNKLVMAE